MDPKDYTLSIIDMNLFKTPDIQPVVFEEISVKESMKSFANNQSIYSNLEKNQTRSAYEYKFLSFWLIFLRGVHVIVLVHGFQGCSHDLKLLKNAISYMYPDTLILCASSNEEKTSGKIARMGIRLASEVKCYIDDWIKDINLGR